MHEISASGERLIGRPGFPASGERLIGRPRFLSGGTERGGRRVEATTDRRLLEIIIKL